jgi:hypothetical protein
VTTSTIPTAAKGKEFVRHYRPSSLCILSADITRFLAISMAGEVVVDCVGLYVVVIGIGDAEEYGRFSLGDPSL